MGLGTDDGDEYFCSLKVHSLMTQIQRRTVLLFDIARLPLRAKCRLLAVMLDASDVFNDIHDTTGFLYGTYSRRFR